MVKSDSKLGAYTVQVSNLSYEPRSGFPVFKNLSFSLEHEKTGLVGSNGVGKTSLLRILAGEVAPSEGGVYKKAKIAYLPQDYQFDLNKNVAETLGVDSSDGLMKARALSTLSRLTFNISDLSRPLQTLSGGERMKVVLSKLIVSEPEFLILDEPTNNLDAETKEAVYELVKSWKGGLLIVSHDRSLLNLMDQIMELSKKGLSLYGGNYQEYVSQKRIEVAALERNLVAASTDLKKAKQTAQRTQEKQEKRSSRGKRMREKIGQPKIVLNAMKRQAEKTSSRLKKVHQERKDSAEASFREAKDAMPSTNKIKVDLSSTSIPSGKLVAELRNVSYRYPGESFLIKDFNLSLYGPERVVIEGSNGSGKTTLVKLMTGDLQPFQGQVLIAVKKVSYLDQTTSILDNEETLVQNVQRVAGIEGDEARVWLARFLFREETVFKKAEILSGGERMRAALACILAGENPPQLLILDEPTNNLDLDSIERIESALSNFKGALIMISHDKEFVDKVGVTRVIKLS